MSFFFLKPSDALKEIILDWRPGYLAPLEIIVADLGWSVQHLDLQADDLWVVAEHHDFHKTIAVFQGGLPEQFYLVSNWIRTSRDRLLERTFVMRITSGSDPSLGVTG